MIIKYEKLWLLMKENKMKKGELQRAIDISFGTMAKLGKGEVVSMNVLLRICELFRCDIGDVMEVIHDE